MPKQAWSLDSHPGGLTSQPCDLNKHTYPVHTVKLLCMLAALNIIKAQGKRV